MIAPSTITVQITVNRSVKETWWLWTEPMHIIKWNAASDDWETTFSENNLQTGGSFVSRMEAKDGSVGFDFGGTYTLVVPYERIEYTMGDGRNVKVVFRKNGQTTLITEEFVPETVHSHEMQKAGWQSILNNFKKYAESKEKHEFLQLAETIKAPVAHVYKTMIDASTYNAWTKAFNPASHYVGTWEKKSLIRFFGVDEKGQRGGMVSRIKENIPHKFISIEHLGIIQGDKEITEGAHVESWRGALENYKFTAEGSNTKLEVCMESNEEFKDYFAETWPNALELLKELCEQ